MGNKMYLVTDPHVLETVLVPTNMKRYQEHYSRTTIDRHRNKNGEVKKNLEMLRRALQILPPRELDMLYATKVNDGIQDKVRGRFSVQQSNISYRLSQAWKRIKLYSQINTIMSETRLRSLLYTVGLSEQCVQIILGIYKTENQSVTAKHLNITQGLARSLFLKTMEEIEKTKNLSRKDHSDLILLMNLIKENFNRLRTPKTQERWENKIGDSNYTSTEKLLRMGVSMSN